MKKKDETGSIFEICPVRNVIARFGDKWSLLTLLIIGEQGVVRFNELNRLIPDISSRVLSSTLRTLEADGLISRKVYPVVPPKVEYRLTDVGISLLPIIRQLTEWAQTNMKRIITSRRNYKTSVVCKGGFSEFRRALPDNALEQTGKMLRILKSEVIGYDSYIVG